ncbi:MAG TPA: dihydrodipicolinate synthase family protein [Planctomycetaceae bacterium]|nr:dihydrodipicolinate synthase family protein [Planctomycetaceae bacterium]
MPRELMGVLPIVHTPFDDDDQIDSQALRREIDWAYSVGANGLGTGMVSEILRLTFDERRELTEQIVEFSAGRGAVFAAVGAESGRQALGYAIHAEQVGCDAVMAAPPLTTRLSVAAHLDYYRELADGVSLPIIVQDASGYVGSAIPQEVYLQLLEQYGDTKILFKPEASPIGPNLSALRDATGGRAKIYEGSGGILLIDSHRRGITGTMPGMDLLDGIVAIWNALERGNEATAYAIYFPICAIVTLQLQAGLDGFLAIEKYLLVKRGLWKSDRRRAPVGWLLDGETAREVDRLFAMLQQTLARL